MTATPVSQPAKDDADAAWLRERGHDLVYGGLPLNAGVRIEAQKRLEAIASRLSHPTVEGDAVREALEAAAEAIPRTAKAGPVISPTIDEGGKG